ncbi:hypothetical protein AAG895_05170 [Thauera sp. JM12B12]|uniref:hypothetical protein n=1 Tax=Thauera sp. JM12B12 TaxID=3142262 RepID=UPI0031F37B1F
MMEQRTRHRLRRLIELTVQAVERGLMPLPKAAETLDAAGAPFEVVCRVLLPFKHGVPGGTDGKRASAWDEFAPR